MADRRHRDAPDVTGFEEEQEEMRRGGDSPDQLLAEIENLRAEKQAAFDKLARAQADFSNSRRRLEKDLDDRLKLAAGHLVKAFLPVLDNLERAMDVPESADVATVVQGVKGTYDQMLDVLRRNNVVPIAPEPGSAFDPTHMEALMQEEADYDAPTVTRLLQRGYEFDGRVLRPAQVAVGKRNT